MAKKFDEMKYREKSLLKIKGLSNTALLKLYELTFDKDLSVEPKKRYIDSDLAREEILHRMNDNSQIEKELDRLRKEGVL